MIRRNLGTEYNPLYFLASLGAGGLSVSFFIYLMFMVEHPDTPMPTFHHVMPLLTAGAPLVRGLVALALVLIAVLAFLHFRLLAWNIGEYRRFRGTGAFGRLRASNAEVTLMAIPLTLAMSINVMFVLGALFVPRLWSMVEYLFPFAIAGFLVVGLYALRIYSDYFARLVIRGDFDFGRNNDLGQMVAIFAFAMVSVGLAAPGAMSHQITVNAVGIFFSILFAAIAVILALIKLVLGVQSILRHGIAEASSPTLWIVIPILTLLGIALVRMTMGLHHGFQAPLSRPGLFVLTSSILAIQLLFGGLGYVVMKRLNYFGDYLHGDKRHPGSYALICPGVALFVFGMFFIAFGLIGNGLVEKFSPAYFLLLAPLVFIQAKTFLTLFRLNRRLLWQSAPGPAVVP